MSAESQSAGAAPDREPLRYASARGRWALAAVILGSGAAFLESSVVSVALPEIGRDLDLELGGLQWVMNAYLLTLSALIITGGSLGDLYGRRIVFVSGLIAFAATSLLCALAPSGEVLIGARILQGVAAALLVPTSLAIVEASFAEEDRGRAIGAWAGWSGVSSLIGPFVGGWLVDAASWRWVFAIVVIAAIGAAWLAGRHLPESRARPVAGRRPDWVGSVLVSLGLAAITYALVEVGGRGLGDPVVAVAAVGGILLLVAFLVVEHRVADPMLPLAIFRSRQFSGANAATLANYLAIGALFFFLSLQLQDVLGYSALAAGAASFPATLIMLTFSPQAGKLGQRFGPRIPMTVGPLVLGAGLILLSGIERGDAYLESILPGVIVFGIGMTIFVAPLTTAVLAALPDERAGIASAVNNAGARLAQLLAGAALPAAAGLSASTAVGPGAFSEGFQTAMLIAAAIAALGGLISWATIRGREPRRAPRHPSPSQACTACPPDDEGGRRGLDGPRGAPAEALE
ncbi:MAG: DHA2 family efflux MFS transporter permease subunit [Solirubrobacterales bacterium]|nr:DHA2 family efflux MFS transporter permease subunit [Solirubrobacterales bacterium]